MSLPLADLGGQPNPSGGRKLKRRRVCSHSQAALASPAVRAARVSRHRWIPTTDDYKTYYRHVLAGPCRIYRAHADDPDRAMSVLATAVAKPGEVVEQSASRQVLITSKDVLAAVTRLYYDADTGSNRRGAAGRGAGSARRLAAVLQQFDLTWDFYEMEPESILALLPKEFDRFRKNT